MTVITPPEATTETTPPELNEAPPTRDVVATVWMTVVAAWKYVVGVALCQSALLSVLVVGWTYRLVARSALKRWWKDSRLPEDGGTFESFVASADETAQHRRWPNWIIKQNFKQSLGAAARREGVIRKLGAFAYTVFASLWRNIKTGATAIANTWVLTLPACSLWVFAWFAGWNNSFHKGYELAYVGPLTGVLGVVLFIAAMFYVPMAQARQAVTGNWRSFYQFRLVRKLTHERWGSCVVLAGLYSLASVPVALLLAMPTFFEQNWPELAALTDAEALDFLKTYYFRVAMFALPLFVLLKVIAGRIYAAAVISGLQHGTIKPEELAPCEQQVLRRLDRLKWSPGAPRNVLIRAVGWTGTRLGRTVSFALIMLLWFTFVAQIFVGEFLNYHGAAGWLNQPLVQLPWFSFIPPGLGGMRKWGADVSMCVVKTMPAGPALAP